MKNKIVIYQLLPRLFSNTCKDPVQNGTIEQNGCGKFNHITNKVLSELSEFGVSHIWLTGILRHATLTSYPQFGLFSSHPDIVKGKAGSPYAVKDYFDVDPDLAEDVPGRIAEFEQLLHRIHSLGLKAIIDFVPNHVARDYHSLYLPGDTINLGETDNKNVAFSPSNNYYYFPGESLIIRGLKETVRERFFENPAKVTGNDVFSPEPDVNDWYETVKLNYGIDYQNNRTYFNPIPNTWKKMTEILQYWSAKGVDGFRCDMAGMVPVDFWHFAISRVKSVHSHVIFIAELYEPSKYREFLETGFFDYLYDKVGLYDTLRAVVNEKSSTQAISKVWQSLEGMDGMMVRFLENHDEQRIASPYFVSDPWKALPAMAVTALMNKGPVLIYAGQEVGEPAFGATGFSGDDGRTSIFDYSVIPELQKWYNHGRCDGQPLTENQILLRNAYSELLHLAHQLPAVSQGYFYDLMWVNENITGRDRIFAFLRYFGNEEEEVILIVTRFDGAIANVRIKIPEHAMHSIGFGGKQRITVRSIYPNQSIEETLLYSQIISVGVQVKINHAGYSVFSLI